MEKLSTDELINRMWDATLPAWLGGSGGAFVIVAAIFWRFVMRPWTVLIDYGGGNVAWYQPGRNVPIFHGPVPPPIPMIDNILPLSAVVLGVCIIWVTNIPRNAVVNELHKRRQVPKQ